VESPLIVYIFSGILDPFIGCSAHVLLCTVQIRGGEGGGGNRVETTNTHEGESEIGTKHLPDVWIPRNFCALFK
jgi:hypothetical protein